jgi:hypothetical protein
MLRAPVALRCDGFADVEQCPAQCDKANSGDFLTLEEAEEIFAVTWNADKKDQTGHHRERKHLERLAASQAVTIISAFAAIAALLGRPEGRRCR